MTPAAAHPAPLAVALLGASGAAMLRLVSALTSAARQSNWPVRIELLADTPAPPAELCRFDLVLLAGLEPDIETCPGAASARADQSIRAALASADVSYQVLYGTEPERLARALHALEALLPATAPRLCASTGPSNETRAATPAGKPRPWVWSCDKCSDPQCEYRLLSDLLAKRASPV